MARHYLNRFRGRKQRARPTTPRACLRCDRTFPSEGPDHRLCQECREYLASTATAETEYAPTRHNQRLGPS